MASEAAKLADWLNECLKREGNIAWNELGFTPDQWQQVISALRTAAAGEADRLEEARKNFQRKLDSLAPFLPPPDKFPDPQPAQWHNDQPRRSRRGRQVKSIDEPHDAARKEAGE